MSTNRAPAEIVLLLVVNREEENVPGECEECRKDVRNSAARKKTGEIWMQLEDVEANGGGG